MSLNLDNYYFCLLHITKIFSVVVKCGCNLTSKLTKKRVKSLSTKRARYRDSIASRILTRKPRDPSLLITDSGLEFFSFT